MKLAVFWYVALCSLVDIDRRFGGAYCHHQGDETETSVNIYQTTRRNIPEDSYQQLLLLSLLL
jgi:hypothetical protein